MEILKTSNDKTKRVANLLPQVTEKLKECHGENLVSLILFGSAAEDRLRDTSDVNLLIILKKFQETEVDNSREVLRVAKAAIDLSVMYLLESELILASEAFAVKFQDIRRRHVVLHGSHLLEKIQVSQDVIIHRLKQVLLNMTLRMRERYVLVGQREDQLQNIIAEFAGPLRSAAAEIIFLKEKKPIDPKSALLLLVQSFKSSPSLDYEQTLKNISICRERGTLPPGESSKTILSMITLAMHMHSELGNL